MFPVCCSSSENPLAVIKSLISLPLLWRGCLSMLLLGFWLFATFEYSAFEMWPMVSMQAPYNSSNGIENIHVGAFKVCFSSGLLRVYSEL